MDKFAMTLAAEIAEIPHRILDLTDRGDPHRPMLRMFADLDVFEGKPPVVTLTIGAMLGQQTRYVDMLPDEARELAKHLLDLASRIDAAEKSEPEPATEVA